jgi:hypothetical protein
LCAAEHKNRLACKVSKLYRGKTRGFERDVRLYTSHQSAKSPKNIKDGILRNRKFEVQKTRLRYLPVCHFNAVYTWLISERFHIFHVSVVLKGT